MTLNDLGTNWQSVNPSDEDKLIHVVGKKTLTDVPICISRELVPIVSLLTND